MPERLIFLSLSGFSLFMRAGRGVAQYRHPRPFKPWLYAVAVNVARDHYKSAEQRRTDSIASDFDAPDPGRVDDDLLAAGAARRVARAAGARSAGWRRRTDDRRR